MLRKFLPLLALLPVALSTYALPQTWFGALALFGYLLACGLAAGPRLAPNAIRPLQLAMGVMATTATLSLLGSVVYYSATVTDVSLLIVLSVTAILAGLISLPSQAPALQFPKLNLDLILFGCGLLCLAGWWLLMLDTQILTAVRSPWMILNPTSLLTLGLAMVCALTLCLRARSQGLALTLLAACLLSGTTLAALSYPLGYGFDPFLHRATVAHIAEFGTITPKPLYYIGQYALELIGVKIFSLPLFSLDTFLAPVLLSLGAVTALATRQAQVKAPTIILASLIFLPLSAFVQTTPQALAFVFTVWALLSPPKPLYVPALFALAALITHPLAGISAVIYVVMLAVSQLEGRYTNLKIPALVIITLAAAISTPLAFVIQAKLAHLSLSFTWQNIFKLWDLPITHFFGTQYSAWGDTAYFFISNAFLIVLLLTIIGAMLTPKNQTGWYIPGLVALTMFSNFVILSLGFDFTFLISYERSDFALRLLTLTTIFLLPYVSVLFSYLATKLRTQPAGLSLGAITLLALVFTSQVYAAYPRHDNYTRSSGFNLSATDFNTVIAIDKHANQENYIVLSDQALAAAAVQELGFKQYYHGDIFFYPIPTGGPLYQHFLDLVENKPDLDTVYQAMDLAGVDLAYFAIHDYWWQAPQIIENTKGLATDWFAIGDNAVTVFVFKRQE
ncbi:MAG: hypothetical protein WAZ14_02445 [Patescibacteria group bacterium]